MAATFLLSLSGCQLRSTPSDSAKIIGSTATIPEELLQECADPVRIPHRDLDEPETGEGWGADRTSLVYCRDSKRALIRAVRVQQGQQQKTPQSKPDDLASRPEYRR